MDNWNVFMVIVALLGFVGTSYTMFYKPTHDLMIQMVKLNENLETLKDSDIKQDALLEKHGDLIHDHEIRIDRLERTEFIKYRED